MDKFTLFSTDSLNLRELQKSDVEDVFEYASDPDAQKFSPWGLDSLKSTENWIAEMAAFINESPRLNFELAICEKGAQKVIGNCRIGIKNPETHEGYIGFTLNKDKWGRGYATEVARALIQFGFKELKLHRIYATSSPLNRASHRVLEKGGMIREGLLRKNILMRGNWRDSVLFAILDEDFVRL